MTTVLLDTNIVSYLFKRDSRAAAYAPHLLQRELAISMMTVADSMGGAARLGKSAGATARALSGAIYDCAGRYGALSPLG